MKENLNTGGKYSIGVFGKKLIGVDSESGNSNCPPLLDPFIFLRSEFQFFENPRSG